jgi:hypothetical protein
MLKRRNLWVFVVLLAAGSCLSAFVLTNSSGRLDRGHPGQTDGSVDPTATQWNGRSWSVHGRYELTVSSVARPSILGMPTHSIGGVLQQNGDFTSIRYVSKNANTFYLYSIAPDGRTISIRPVAAAGLQACEPSILQPVPLLVRCSRGPARVVSFGGGDFKTWSIAMPGPVNAAYYVADPQPHQLEILEVPPTSGSTADVREVIVATSGKVLADSAHSIRVLSTASGGQAAFAPTPAGGWVAVSDTWVNGGSTCIVVTRFDSSFRVEWTTPIGSTTLRGGCYGQEVVGPQVSGSEILFDSSNSPIEQLFDVGLDGSLRWHSVINDSMQSGLSLPPIMIADSNGRLWLADINDGTFVGDSAGAPIDFAYLAELQQSNGSLVWKARMTSPFTSGHYWLLLTPRTIVSTDGQVEMLDFPLEGNPSSSMPVALLLRVKEK